METLSRLSPERVAILQARKNRLRAVAEEAAAKKAEEAVPVKPLLAWTNEELTAYLRKNDPRDLGRAVLNFYESQMPACCGYQVIGSFYAVSEGPHSEVALARAALSIRQRTKASALLATTIPGYDDRLDMALRGLGFTAVSKTKNKNTSNIITLWTVDVPR